MLPVLATCLFSLAISSTPVSLPGPVGEPRGVAERFVARSWEDGTRRVHVAVARDALAVTAAPGTPAHALARLAERAALELAPTGKAPVSVAGARRLRTHGLFVVELADGVERAQLVDLAQALAASPGIQQVYPVHVRGDGRAFTDDHLVIHAQHGQLEAVVNRVLRRTGGTLVRRSRVPDVALVRVGSAVERDAVTAAQRVAGIPGLRVAEPELFREYELLATVDDPMHGNQWFLHRDGANVPVPGVGQIFAHAAWDITKGDPAVVVAVFDSGIDVTHEDLAPNIVSQFDPSAGDDSAAAECSSSPDGAGQAQGCSADAPYFESHGTAVSGIVAARGDNGIGVSGVCPRCSLMAVRLLGDQVGSGLSTAEAFVRAVDEGAWVINNSWGPGRSRYFPMSAAERAAFDHARTTGRGGKGTVIVFAAGNSTRNVASDPYASHPYALAVAASTNLDDWASYSNYGLQIDVAAPSLGGTVQQDNYGLFTTDVTGANGYAGETYYADFSGTSAASPVVAGLAGLMLSANPALTAEQLRVVLTSTADKIRADKVNWLELTGQDIEAIFEYDEFGHSIGFGYGRINAARAVARANHPPIAGGACPAPGCAECTADGRCLLSCVGQWECTAGTVCEDGLCQLPRVQPGDIGSPCTSECTACTTTLDTEGFAQAICTITCGKDEDCPSGFDCRGDVSSGAGVCAVGSTHAGERDNLINCRSDLFGISMVVENRLGQFFCTDACFTDDPGACPEGFGCSTVRCSCATSQSPCRKYVCEASNPGPSAWPTSMCVPDMEYGVGCTADLHCPPGDYCAPNGLCRPDDRQGCSVCQACSSDDDCTGGTMCMFSFSGGYCTRGCAEDVGCPGNSVCREVRRRTSNVLLCVSPGGDPAAPCNSGYACEVACREDVPCPAGMMCEAGACVDAPDPPITEPPPTDPPADDDDDTGPFGLPAPGCSQAGEATGTWLVLAGLVLGLRRRRRS